MSATATARVRVPASTSNLGAGFDCIGVAVDRWLSASVVAREGDGATGTVVTMTRAGELASSSLPPAADLVHAGFTAACESRGRALPARLDYTVRSTIPVARGLGSSAAALIAGAMLADVALDLGLGREGLAALCAGVEGHSDNVGAAVFGGAVLSLTRENAAAAPRYTFASLRIHSDLALVFAVPNFEVKTSAARAALPKTLPHATAAVAAAKSAALVHGLAAAEAALLVYALDDVLHVPFRRASVRGYDTVVDAGRAAGAYGVTLSGSGSTLAAVVPRSIAEDVAAAMRDAWMALGVEVETIVAAEPVRGAERS
jgi:homoserine kinase